MATRTHPAIVTLRMSRSLRDALHAAAHGEGCSLNAYALQILAAAAGDPARFRSDAGEEAPSPRDLERDDQGFPLRRKERAEHRAARSAFIDVTAAELGYGAASKLVYEHDVQDPAFFVEWERRRAS